ncbi:MAG: hypothetical protein NWE93_07190 [Candidatus Bathyarchaeota archaeon]|nr:hypothetical protein [Candidatus Bathyarchaeota archaeon]
MALNRTCSFFLIALLLGGVALGCLGAISAESVPKPAVPQFTIKYVPASYSTTTTDPYTGQTTTTQHPNRTIQITMTNQPTIGSNHSIYYNIRVRPHFEGNWTELYPLWKLPTARYDWDTETWTYSQYLYTQEMPLALQTPIQSSGQYTTVNLPLDENPRYPLSHLPDSAQLDFQVEALVGHAAQSWAIQHPLNPEYGGYYVDSVAYDSDSGWSGTKTINLADSSVTIQATPNHTSSPDPTLPSASSPLPTATSAQPEGTFEVPPLSWIEISAFTGLVVVVVLLAVFVVALSHKVQVLEGKLAT